jgi:HD-GYP domain-containing protein (c-di-GMP phosphodiesterase class II)
MVRISDLVKGNTPPPVSKSDDRGGGAHLSNLSELIHWDRNASPPEAAPDERPGVAPKQPPEATPGKTLEPAPDTPPVKEEAALEEPPDLASEKPPEVPSEKAIGVAHEASPERPVASRADIHLSSDSKTIYLNAQSHLRDVRERLLKGKPISLVQPLEMIRQMIAEPSLADELYQLTLALGHGKDLYIASPVNSMIYSFKIGTRMGYSPTKLTEVCLAALHHDVGMFLIPKDIIQKDGKLTESEFAVIKRHVETGRDLFTSLNYPKVSRAICEHHERQNGQGYPAGLKGDKISEYSEIIGICDSYEAMTHDRPHKKAAAQYLSVLQLAGSKDMLFAPHIVKMFLDVITLYPIGSYVRLNNKTIGIVVETNPHNLLKPVVRILVDGHGKKTMEEKLINLAENNILTIVAGVSAEELSA